MPKCIVNVSLDLPDIERINTIRKHTMSWDNGASRSSAIRSAIRLYAKLVELGDIEDVRKRAGYFIKADEMPDSDLPPSPDWR